MYVGPTWSQVAFRRRREHGATVASIRLTDPGNLGFVRHITGLKPFYQSDDPSYEARYKVFVNDEQVGERYGRYPRGR